MDKSFGHRYTTIGSRRILYGNDAVICASDGVLIFQVNPVLVQIKPRSRGFSAFTRANLGIMPLSVASPQQSWVGVTYRYHRKIR